MMTLVKERQLVKHQCKLFSDSNSDNRDDGSQTNFLRAYFRLIEGFLLSVEIKYRVFFIRIFGKHQLQRHPIPTHPSPDLTFACMQIPYCCTRKLSQDEKNWRKEVFFK